MATSTMSPVRVGLVGLAASDPRLGGAAWGMLAHLPSIIESPNYQLVALCNSTVASAQQSIEFHKLPADTKAYGSIEALVSDPDIDLVVVSVRVGKHYELAKPALLTHKSVYVEWPLAANLTECEELVQLAKNNKVPTIVGLQARADPLLIKLKEIIASDKIGRITSAIAWGCSSALPFDGFPEGSEYYLDINSGGNEFYIFFGHFLDSFINILGDFADLQATLQVQKPTVPIVDRSGQIIQSSWPKTSPDHVSVQGVLQNGASASLNFRSASSAVDGLGVRWIISGEKGELEITMPECHWQMGSPQSTFKIKIGKSELAEDISFHTTLPSEVAAVSFPGTNTAGTYEAFVKNDTRRYATFESALKTHRLLHRILDSSGFNINQRT